MEVLVFLVVCVVGVTVGNAKSLDMPSYLKACVYSDPGFDACALKTAQDGFPIFARGDKKYRIPILDPFVISQLHVNEGVLGLNMSASNAIVHGLKHSHVDAVEYDAVRKFVRYNLTVPRLEIEMNYDINGRILILPITGSGPGNLTAINMKLSYSYEYDLKKKKDGLNYAVPKNGHLDLNMSRLYVKLENLFNGNKLLGDQMNVFMDENWKDLVKDIGPVIGEAISEITKSFLANIFDLVSYEKAILDAP